VFEAEKTCSIGGLLATPLSAFTFSVSVLNQQKIASRFHQQSVGHQVENWAALFALCAVV
jgi:hypothetical protein